MEHLKHNVTRRGLWHLQTVMLYTAFLDIERKLRIFCNIWSLVGFKGSRRISPVGFRSLTYFQIVVGYSKENNLSETLGSRRDLWYCKQEEVCQNPECRSRVDHCCSCPILTTSYADSPRSEIFEGWKADSPSVTPH